MLGLKCIKCYLSCALLSWFIYHIATQCPLCQPLDYDLDDGICKNTHLAFSYVKPYTEPAVKYYNESPIKPCVDKTATLVSDNYKKFVAPTVEEYYSIIIEEYVPYAKGVVNNIIGKAENIKLPDADDIKLFSELKEKAKEITETSSSTSSSTTESAVSATSATSATSADSTASTASTKDSNVVEEAVEAVIGDQLLEDIVENVVAEEIIEEAEAIAQNL